MSITDPVLTLNLFHLISFTKKCKHWKTSTKHHEVLSRLSTIQIYRSKLKDLVWLAFTVQKFGTLLYDYHELCMCSCKFL